jgi:RHS repeat-associated protein
MNETGEIENAMDYYPFGEELTGRSINYGTNAKYKFTGKERDTETSYDYGVYPAKGGGARYYDSKLGRWLQVDPLAEKYPGWSTYNYSMDNPLLLVDIDGREIHIYLTNSSKKEIDFNKVANYMKSQFEAAGVKDVNIYYGKAGYVKYFLGTYVHENNYIIDCQDISPDGPEITGDDNRGGSTKNVYVKPLSNSSNGEMETGVANVAAYEIGHDAKLKHPTDKEKVTDDNTEGAYDDGSIMGTKGGDVDNLTDQVRTFRKEDEKKLQETFNK